ncbi:MAG: polyamine aminopropyltransferase [Gammaproteobacteria bacterium]|nr:polyamine aminopropyltransferase [Gammaproteobacteria bacterium]
MSAAELQGWFTEKVEDKGVAFSLKLGEHVHGETTPYQRIDIYSTASFGYLMAIDGCTMVSSRDNFFYHEMMAHPALNSHPAPRRVAVIGGGDCGTLNEVLKHPQVERAVQIEIDERVTRLAERYFPELCARNGDPRAELVFGDGIAWIKSAPPASLDVIVVDSTDPVGPAEGLFGRRFYADCLCALDGGGLLVQQSESPLLHLDLIVEMHRFMRESGFAHTRLLHFPQPVYPSGWWSATLAQKTPGPLTARIDEAAIAKLQTRYYCAATHGAAFALPPFVAGAVARPE